jgi:hypothetical protein
MTCSPVICGGSEGVFGPVRTSTSDGHGPARQTDIGTSPPRGLWTTVAPTKVASWGAVSAEFRGPGIPAGRQGADWIHTGWESTAL